MIFTIGHSDYDLDTFLRHARWLTEIWDVRSHPGSAHAPQFDQGRMQRWLPVAGIQYRWEPDLGGWNLQHESLAEIFAPVDVDILAYCNGQFPKQRISKKRQGTGWDNYGFWDYSWIMTLPAFGMAARKLMLAATVRDIGIMCAEALWWKCHRSMISDYLAFCAVDSFHIMGKDRWVSHMGAMGDRLGRYDERILNTWREWDIRASLR